MRKHRKRRGIAALVATGLMAGLLGGIATPASAAPQAVECFGRDQANQELIDLLATLGGSTEPPPASLELAVDITANVPQAVDVGATGIPVDFDAIVELPASLLETAGTLGVTTASANNVVATVSATNASPATIASPPDSQTIDITTTSSVTLPNFGGTLDATGPDQSQIQFRLDNLSLDVVTGPIPGLFPTGLQLQLECDSTSTAPFATTDILQPGPPIAPDFTTAVPLGGTRTINLTGITGNPPVDNVVLDNPAGALGAGSVSQVGNVWRFTYVHDQLAGDGTDVFTYTASNAFDGGSSTQGTITVDVLGNTCEANPACSLDQIIEFDVEGTTLSMEQDGGEVILDTVTLDGTPQTTTGELNNVTVTDARGDGSGWDLVGQVTDFKTDGSVPNCPRGTPSTWSYQCIPANNLGWAPGAVVAHQQIPGDVADVDAGSASVATDIADGVAASGLEAQQALCTADPTTNGGTFVCGAGLALLVPASASAGTYSATLTLTLS